MQLSKFSDYSLRVLIYLAGQPDTLSTIDEISARYGISKDHLRKIVHNLVQSGWVESKRGRNGGLSLSMNPASISIGKVVRSTEENLAIVECFNAETDTCQISGVCRLSGMLDEALQAFLSVLDKYSLDDITAGQSALMARLGLLTFDTSTRATT